MPELRYSCGVRTALWKPCNAAAIDILQVNLKLFTPAPGKRRTVLLFVFRDRTKTPLARLVETWEEDLHRMWTAIPKPPTLEGTSVTDFFEVPLDAHLSQTPTHSL
jgi:Root hair defective 3 GTP-binding protein (RHD3)